MITGKRQRGVGRRKVRCLRSRLGFVLRRISPFILMILRSGGVIRRGVPAWLVPIGRASVFGFFLTSSTSTTTTTQNPDGTSTTTTTTKYKNDLNGTGTTLTTVVTKDANGNVISEATSKVGNGTGDGSGTDTETMSGGSGFGELENNEDWGYSAIKGRVSEAIQPAQNEVASLVTSGVGILRGAFPFSLLTGSLSGFGGTPQTPCFTYTLIGDTEEFCLSAFEALFAYIRAAIGLLAVFGFYLLMLRTIREWGTS